MTTMKPCPKCHSTEHLHIKNGKYERCPHCGCVVAEDD